MTELVDFTKVFDNNYVSQSNININSHNNKNFVNCTINITYISYEKNNYNNSKSSHGTIKINLKEIYKGEILNNLPNGLGVMIYEPIYQGHLFNNYYHDIGGEYTGEFKNGDCDGYGTMVYLNKLKYVGYWKNNKFEGLGILICTNGIKYHGIFKDGLIDGYIYIPGMNISYGTWKIKNGYVENIKEKKEKKKEGYEEIIYLNGIKYCGYWKDDKREGFGIMIYLDKKKYCGYWKNNKRQGYGYIKYPNGEKYVGYWENNNLKSYGYVEFSSKKIYYGYWVDNKFENSSILYNLFSYIFYNLLF